VANHTILLRSPSPTEVELVIGSDHEMIVYQLSFEQLRLLAEQATVLLCRWPIVPQA
jgi:hypothetical protein